MKDLKIKRKLVLSFLIVAVFSAVVGAVGVFDMLRISADKEKLYAYSVNIGYAGLLVSNMQRQVGYRDLVIFINDAGKKSVINANLNTVIAEFDTDHNLQAVMEKAAEIVSRYKLSTSTDPIIKGEAVSKNTGRYDHIGERAYAIALSGEKY